VIGIQLVIVTKVVKILDTNLHVSLHYQGRPARNVVGVCCVAASGRHRDRGPLPYLRSAQICWELV
jgi:hypothetical protein